MKRIEFISPVEAMRGNLSRKKQTLLYAENDNPAWDAPVGTRVYARNYQPSFIGAKVAGTGRKYFAIKTKSAITVTPASKVRMALLSVSSVIADIISKNLSIASRLQMLYVANHPTGWSYKRWLMYYVREGLANKTAITFPGYEQLAAVFVKNPFINTTQPSSATDISEDMPKDILSKFWMQLANLPVEYLIDDVTPLIGHSGDSFTVVVASKYNVAGLTIVDGNVKLGDKYLQYRNDEMEEDAWEYVEASDTLGETDAHYRTTEVAPEP